MDKNSALKLEDYLSYFSLNEDTFWDSAAEEKVYNILLEVIDEHYIIFPHIAFKDIFKIEGKKIPGDLYDKFLKYHFDFVIFDINFIPVLLIEINGSSHTLEWKSDIDKFKKLLSSKCDLPLASIDLLEHLNDREFKIKICRSLVATVDSRRKCNVYCPKCKNILTYKLNKDRKGSFYYCSHCKNPYSKEPKHLTFDESKIPPLFKPVIKTYTDLSSMTEE